MFLDVLLTSENILAALISIIIVVGIFFGIYFILKNTKSKNNPKEEGFNKKRNEKIVCLVETSILVAFSVVLELIFKMIPFMDMPQGRSISLTMLPLLMISFRRGPLYGVLGGLVFSIINLLIDGTLYHWSSFFLDYTFAFGLIGLAGVVNPLLKDNSKKNIIYLILGSLLGIFFRLCCATLSGIIAFETPFIASLVYNAPYILISGMICIIIIISVNRIILYKIED